MTTKELLVHLSPALPSLTNQRAVRFLCAMPWLLIQERRVAMICSYHQRRRRSRKTEGSFGCMYLRMFIPSWLVNLMSLHLSRAIKFTYCCLSVVDYLGMARNSTWQEEGTNERSR